MARASTLVLFMSFVLFASFVSSSHARKLLTIEDHNKKAPASLEPSLILSALPKGKVTPSAPSKKGHALVDNEKLFARHLTDVERMLRSVPSPGVGH